MSKIFLLAWRNLWRNRKRTFITLASIVFAVIIATFMRGIQLGSYEKMLNDAIQNTSGHIAIMGKDYWEDKSLINSMPVDSHMDSLIQSNPLVEVSIPKITSGCLVSFGNATRGVLVMGVDPELEDFQSGLKNKMIAGQYLSSQNSVIIGEDLARYLKADVGDSVVLLGQGYQGMTAAGLYPITGIFSHPLGQLNKRVVYISLGTAEDLFFMYDRRSQQSIVLKDYTDEDKLMSIITPELDTSLYEVQDWRVMNKEILQNIESDNFFGIIMIGILYMVIGFGVFGTILMMVMERRKEFSVMIAIGMKRRKLLTVVIVEAVYMAIIGSIVGLMLAFPLVLFYYFNPITFTGEQAELYYEFNMEPILQVSLQPDYMVAQFLIVLVLSLIASILPLNSILKLDIVKVIRGRQ